MNAIVKRSGEVPRYTPGQRANHWLLVVLFILMAASGLAFFHPAFWFLANLLGGGPWARILHPFLGVVMFVAFFWLAAQFWGENRIEAYDREWSKRLGDVVNNRDQGLPEIGKYNYGQKMLFQTLVVTMLLLIVSGVIMWRPYFAGYFPITAVRIAAVVHAFSAFVLILAIIVHLYAALWVKGSIRAMTRGGVSHAWAKHHHPLWYRKVTGVSK